MTKELDLSTLKKRNKKWMAMLNDIKERSNNTKDVHMVEGIKDVKLTHGLSLISSIKLLGEYLDICYCGDAQEYFVLDDNRKVHRYSMQGKLILPSIVLTSSMVFTKIIWCAEVKMLSCFAVDSDLLWILTVQFRIIAIIKNEFKVSNVFFLPGIDELLVIGATNMAIYPMRDLDKTVECSKTINFTVDHSTPIWSIQQSTLMQDNSSSPKIVGSYLTTIFIFPTTPEKNVGNHEPIKFITKKPGASPALITALHFDFKSQWIICGDQLGNVSGWSVSLECTLKCLNGHRGAVKIIISHPSICGFVTSARDDVLQIWSCNFREKVESFKDLGAISCMAINPSAFSIASLGLKLNFFYMQQLYKFFAPLTASAATLLFTITPMHPTRIIVQTSDNNISILSSVGAKQLNIAMLPQNETPVSISYSEITRSIYSVTDVGEIIVRSIETRPMETRKVWKDYEKIISCIAVYDYYDECHGRPGKTQRYREFIRPIRARILVGTTTGEIGVVDETTGKYEQTVVAHNGRIRKLYVSTTALHVSSIAEDKCIKIWRMLPTIAFPLALMNSIYHSNPITNIASMGFVICFVSNSSESQSYQLLMYDIKERIKLDHHPSKDHSGEILGIATSQPLLICATSADDKTIRVWDKHNHLIKILIVNIRIKELAFSSLRGDIVFGVVKHLYRLPYENYLSMKYKAVILSADIPDDEEELSIIKNDKYDEYVRDDDKMKVLHPMCSIPLGSLDSSAEAPCLELILQQHISIQLKSRDEDIVKIRDGMVHRIRKVKQKALMNHEDWIKYVNELIGAQSEKKKEIAPVHNVWKHLEDYKTIKKPYETATQKKNKHDECSVGFIPNSVIVAVPIEKEVLPASPIPPKAMELKYVYPDELQDNQMIMGDTSSFAISMLEDLNAQ